MCPGKKKKEKKGPLPLLLDSYNDGVPDRKQKKKGRGDLKRLRRVAGWKKKRSRRRNGWASFNDEESVHHECKVLKGRGDEGAFPYLLFYFWQRASLPFFYSVHGKNEGKNCTSVFQLIGLLLFSLRPFSFSLGPCQVAVERPFLLLFSLTSRKQGSSLDLIFCPVASRGLYPSFPSLYSEAY